MKKKIIILTVIMLIIIIGIGYLYRNNYYKGDIYYIEKVQKENAIMYNGNIPNPHIIKTIDYNKDIKIIFWEDTEKGVSCSIVEHFDRDWICIGGSGFGEVRLNNLSLIEYQPANCKYPKIYMWNAIIDNNSSQIVLDNEHIFKKIPLKNNKEIIYYITTENNIINSNYVPILSFYNNGKISEEIQSYII